MQSAESLSWNGGSGNERKGIDTRNTSKKELKDFTANGLLGNLRKSEQEKLREILGLLTWVTVRVEVPLTEITGSVSTTILVGNNGYFSVASVSGTSGSIRRELI